MRRYLIVSASMGAGHDQAAHELASRLTATGGQCRVVDLLTLLPRGVETALRSGYAGMLRFAPWLYTGIYRTFFRPHGALRPSVSPLTRLAEGPLMREVEAFRADEVVSTFHIAAQVTGRLRARGTLTVPASVAIVDMAVHDMWLHPGNDAYLCVHPTAARHVHERTGRPAEVIAPLVGHAFSDTSAEAATAVRAELGLRPDVSVVLVTAGSWGTGDPVETIRVIASTGRYTPVALCGRNDRLRRRIAGAGAGVALGWRDDVPRLIAASDAVVENAGGATAYEAMAAGVPVVVFRPIPGHGRDCATALAEANLAVYPDTPARLLAFLDDVTDPTSPARQRLLDAATRLFTAPSLPSGAGGVGPAAPGFLRVINGESPCEQITLPDETAQEVVR